MAETIANILSIAGSDPSGGAGIQADLKSFAARGTYGMAALTALTAQNTQGVSGVHLVSPAFVAAQIAAVFSDVRVDAVKIGMIASAEIAEAVADALEHFQQKREAVLRPEMRQNKELERFRDSGKSGNAPGTHCAVPVVLDPVMVAKGGASLLAREAVEALTRRLLPLAAVLTPNLPEAAALLGEAEATDRAGMEDQARRLLALGPRAVLLKGGHLPGAESPDVLASPDGLHWFEGARTPTRNTHGTGCSLSSAIAAELGKGQALGDAVASAKSFIAGAVRSSDALNVGSGHGPLHHFHALWT